MKGLRIGIATLTLLGSFGLTCTLGAENSVNSINGQKVNFSTSPSWTYSAIWGPGGDTLLLVDVLPGKVRIYDANGQHLEDLPNQIGNVSLTNPTIIHNASPETFWVEDEDAKFLLFDSNYKVIKTENVGVLAKGSQGNLRAVYQWAPMGEDLLVFGDIRKDDYATSAFLRIPLQAPNSFEIILKVGLEDPARRFYLVGAPYVASVNNAPYFLVMGEVPYIRTPGGFDVQFLRITKSGSELLHRPELPTERGMTASRLLFRRLEESTMPAGLYSWHGSLYVLMRTPVGQSNTAWSMFRIDPKTGKTIWTRTINSTANHLMVVPGEKYWAFIEKGVVEGPGQQSVDSFLRVPAREFGD